jgi:hypothetical protein
MRATDGARQMATRLDDLVKRLKNLEDEFEREIEDRRGNFHYRISRGRVTFEKEIAKEHRQLKVKIAKFLRDSPIASLLIAPFVYGLIVPLLILDLSVWLYQAVCFTAWGIAPVRRSDYIVLDRRHLAYLNFIQKVNCEFCSYANGLISYVQEVAARTEQFWCPIKHAVRVKSQHARYRYFIEYGDAEGFRERLDDLREDIRRAGDRAA